MVILVDRNASGAGGHHGEYLATVEGLLSERGMTVELSPSGLARLFSRDPILFMMIEESPVDFFLSALTRALLRRRTTGLLFRSGECVAPTTLRLRLKRAALKFLKRFSPCSVVTILPFSVDREFERIAAYGIYDLQLWDLKRPGVLAEPPKSDLVSAIDAVAGSRRIVAALGSQNSEKAFDYFCTIWSAPANARLRQEFLFVSGGRVVSALSEQAAEFERSGGVLVDRPLTADELSALYLRSDAVWCCYAPHYNQASGIFGRAVQYGKPAIVRRGSYIAQLAEEIGHPVVELAWGNPEAAAERLQFHVPSPRDATAVSRCVAEMRSQSLACLGTALGIALQA
jgi:hypothetical protein